MTARPQIHGLIIQFETAQDVLDAARKAWEAGYRQMDAYTPYPVEGLAQQLGQVQSRIPFVVFVCGLVGASAGYFMQYWSMAVDYPLNVGGRPLNSWPAYIQVTFETMVLVASLGAFLGMLFLNGLPHPYHPVFAVPDFERASQDRFFLCIEAEDELFDIDATASFLNGVQHIGNVVEVPLDRPTEADAETPVTTPSEQHAVHA